jgi:anti-anti-sigma factor
MEIDVEDKGNYQLVRCYGLLGSDIRDFFDRSIHSLIEDSRTRILFDLSQVDRITSDGISVLVTLVSRANAKGSRVVFANPSPFVQAVFQVTKIDRFLETEPTVDRAVTRLLESPRHD